jgi:hypothetical protein
VGVGVEVEVSGERRGAVSGRRAVLQPGGRILRDRRGGFGDATFSPAALTVEESGVAVLVELADSPSVVAVSLPATAASVVPPASAVTSATATLAPRR